MIDSEVALGALGIVDRRAEHRMIATNYLDLLGPEQSEAILLTKLYGLTVREAAKRIEVSESAMKTRVHRGLRHLRKLIDADRWDKDGG